MATGAVRDVRDVGERLVTDETAAGQRHRLADGEGAALALYTTPATDGTSRSCRPVGQRHRDRDAGADG